MDQKKPAPSAPQPHAQPATPPPVVAAPGPSPVKPPPDYSDLLKQIANELGAAVNELRKLGDAIMTVRASKAPEAPTPAAHQSALADISHAPDSPKF